MSDPEYSFDLDDRSTDSASSASTTTTSTRSVSPKAKPKTGRSRTSRSIYITDNLKRLVYENVALYGKVGDFNGFCNQNEELFGAPGSKLRKAVQRYRNHLLHLLESNPKKFHGEAKKIRGHRDQAVQQEHSPSGQQRDTRKPKSRNSLSSISKSILSPSRSTPKKEVIAPTTPTEIMPPKYPTYVLDFIYPENNPNEWIPFVVKGVKQNNCRRTLVVLQKGVMDQNDLMTEGLKVTIQPGGKEVLVEEHAISSYRCIHHAKSLRWMKRNDPKLGLQEASQQFKDKLKSIMYLFDKDKSREFKKYFLAFPDGITVKSLTGDATLQPGIDFIEGFLHVDGIDSDKCPVTYHTTATFVLEQVGETEVVTDESSSRGLLQTMLSAFASLHTDDSDDDNE
jgi:hypothetical protein